MSTTIDQKVVEMRFDNQQFEKGVATTLNSIEKLEKSLDLKGASKGLENVESAAKRCDMSGLSNGLDAVKMKFSALEVAGMTVISNLTNSAVNFGKRIVSSLTIDPVRMGFSEYELKMGSIQTIMASTGESLETVNKYLNELNEYSDKTIYSFSDMTQNIGKFTNAGVSLEDSVAAIQGVSNVAAVSGANANEASRAMYNFAQALSSGYVKLIDWKSIELANMGTVEFKNQLLEAAAAAGTLTKTGDGMYKTVDGKVVSATKNFNDSLQDQWMTSEVLINTLKEYSDESTEIGKKAAAAATEVKTLSQLYDTLKESAQSGWAQTWEIIVGDFEEAKKFLSELNELIGGWIGRSAEARNDMLENWKVLGGRTALLDSFRNIVEGIGSIIKPISQAFRDIFPPMTAERLLGFTEGLRNLTARLKVSDETAENIRRTFRGLFAILDIGRMIFVAVINAVGKLLSPMGNLNGGILSVTAGIGDLLVGIRDFIESSNIINGVFSLLGSAIGWVIDLTGKSAKLIGDTFSKGPIKSIVDFLRSLKISVSDTFFEMGDAIEGSTFYKIIGGIGAVLTTIAGVVTNVLGKAFKGFSDAFSKGGIVGVLELIVNGGIGIAIVKLITTIAGALKKADGIRDAIQNLVETLDDVFGALKKTFQAFTNAINAHALKTIAGAILTLVIALFALTLIDKDKLMDALSVLTVLVIELTLVMKVLNGFKANKLGASMKSLAWALLLMVIPLKILSSMSWEEMGRGLAGLTGMLLLLVGTLKFMSKIKTTGVLRNITMIKSIVWALILTTIPLAIIGFMSWESIGKGLAGMAGMLINLTTVLAILSKIKTNGVLKNVTMIKSITGALILMTIPLVIIGFMSWESIGKGLAGMAGMLLIISGILAILSKIKTNGVLKNVTMITTIAAALILLTIPLVAIGFMSWESIAKGLTGMAGVLLIVSGILFIMSKVKANGVLKNVTMLTTIAAALLIMSVPFIAIGLMGWERVATGLIGLAGILGLVLATLATLSKIKTNGVLKNVSLLYGIAGALVLLTVPLLVLGLMPWESMVQGLNGLAAVLVGLIASLALMSLITKIGGTAGVVGVLFAVAGAITVLVPALIALSLVPTVLLVKSILTIAAAFLVLGVAALVLSPLVKVVILLAAAMLTVGVGLLAAGLGVTAFAIGLGILSVSMVAFGSACVALVSMIGSVATVIVTVLEAVILGLARGIGQGIIEIIKVITAAVPEIGKLIKVIIVELCDVLIECIPKIVDTILILISEILKALASFIPDIVKSIGELLVGLIGGLAEIIGPIIDKIVDLIVAIIEGIARGIEPIVAAILDLLMALINGAIKGIAGMDIENLDLALKNVGKLAAIIALLAVISALTPLAMVGVLGLASVVGTLTPVLAAFGAISRIPGLQDLVDDGGSFLQSVGNAIGNFVGGIIGGIGEGISAALPAIGTNLSSFMTNIQPFIDGARLIDESAVTGIKNLVNMILMITGASILESIASFLTGGSSMARFASELVLLGNGLAGFSLACSAVNMERVKAGTDAAVALAEMANKIPNQGGLVSLFAGDNSVAAWAPQLPILGVGLAGFSAAVALINPEKVKAAASAALEIANMANAIPNQGGLVSLFSGDNSVAAWAPQLPILGAGLAGFSTAVAGINAENVTAAANAAKTIADMASVIPNEGGIVSWFTGDNSIANWGDQLPKLGKGLKAFSDSVTGITPETVVAAANAAKAIAEMTAIIPNEGGVVSWFAGESSISKFGSDLESLGKGIKAFSDVTTGIVPENVVAASNAAKALAEMTATIPKEGGMVSWFTGTTDIEGFADKLPELGKGLKGFSDSVAGVVPENVTAAANAAKALADMTATIPNEGGIKSWFTGESSVTEWAGKLPDLGKGLLGFSTSVAGIVPENVTAAASAAKSLAEMTDVVPKNTDKIVEFGDNLAAFGGKLKTYFDAMAKVSAETISATSGVVDAVNKVASINATSTESAAKAITKLTEAIKGTSGITGDSTSGFVTAVKKLASVSADAFVKSFEEITKKMKEVGKTAIEAFVKGVSDNTKTAKSAGTDLAEACADAAGDAKSSFTTAGKNLVEGFADGISVNTYMAEAKARAMAKAAAEAAKEQLDINSPSKVFRAIGTSVPEGFAQGIDRFGGVVEDSVAGMSTSAVNGLKNSISRIADAVDADIDSEPVIRPVLDLTNVEAGMYALGRMVNIGSSVGLMANVGAINSGMRKSSQNGNGDEAGNNTSNVTNNTYIVEGVTYDDGSNIATAVEEIVHAARVERRT